MNFQTIDLIFIEIGILIGPEFCQTILFSKKISICLSSFLLVSTDLRSHLVILLLSNLHTRRLNLDRFGRMLHLLCQHFIGRRRILIFSNPKLVLGICDLLQNFVCFELILVLLFDSLGNGFLGLGARGTRSGFSGCGSSRGTPGFLVQPKLLLEPVLQSITSSRILNALVKFSTESDTSSISGFTNVTGVKTLGRMSGKIGRYLLSGFGAVYHAKLHTNRNVLSLRCSQIGRRMNSPVISECIISLLSKIENAVCDNVRPILKSVSVALGNVLGIFSSELRRRLNAPETVPGHSGLGSNLGHLIPNTLLFVVETICIAFGSLFTSCFGVTSPDCFEIIEHSANAKPIVMPNVFVKPASEIVPEIAKSTLDSFPHLCNKVHNSKCNLGSSITDHLAQSKD